MLKLKRARRSNNNKKNKGDSKIRVKIPKREKISRVSNYDDMVKKRKRRRIIENSKKRIKLQKREKDVVEGGEKGDKKQQKILTKIYNNKIGVKSTTFISSKKMKGNKEKIKMKRKQKTGGNSSSLPLFNVENESKTRRKGNLNGGGSRKISQKTSSSSLVLKKKKKGDADGGQ